MTYMLELLESSKSPLSIVSLSGYRATAGAIARMPLPILSNTAVDVMVWAEVDPEHAFRAALPSTRLDEWPLAGVLHHSSIMVRKDRHRATGGSSPQPPGRPSTRS